MIEKSTPRPVSDDKARLRAYFDGIGFARWSAIYGQGELSAVRRTIREGHAQMLHHATRWLGNGAGQSALDAGCGTGLFSLALARAGYAVTAIDLAPQMAEATTATAVANGLAAQISASAGDLELHNGRYDLVACFDVLIHYPANGFTAMLNHLADMAQQRLLISYAPYSPLLAGLHRIGQFFPHGERHTNIHMVRSSAITSLLDRAGFVITQRADVRNGFYHISLIEASRVR